MIFSQADIEAHIAPTHFDKGWQLFTDGHVTAPNIQRDGALITTIIPQAGGRPLRVYVRTSSETNSITINGECSCGQQKNCEHVAAVLLQALEDQQALPGNKRSGQPRSQQALLYFLHIDEDGLLVETNVARRLPHDGYSVIRRFEPGHAASRSPAWFLAPTDLELLIALDKLPRAPVTGFPILDSPHSARAPERPGPHGCCRRSSSRCGRSFPGRSWPDLPAGVGRG